MNSNTFEGGIDSVEQLKQYAKDMARIYQSEKKKRKDLEIAKDKLQEACRETINRLVIASEYRDEDTGDHIVRIAAYSALIAEKYGLSEAEVEQIHITAPMHDVGKIGIPDGILLKPGKLTSEEFETIKSHTLIGEKILGGSSSEILQLAAEIALTHHEKWNGKGYPKGLSGTTIPLAGRIVAIADVFDALTSKRPYKDPFPIEVAFDIIKKERGEHFDSVLANAFLNNIDEVLKIKAETMPERMGNRRWAERPGQTILRSQAISLPSANSTMRLESLRCQSVRESGPDNTPDPPPIYHAVRIEVH